MAQQLTAIHATLTELTRKVEQHGHKLYMDNFFSSYELFDDLIKKIDCCGTLMLHSNGMPHDQRHKAVKLRQGQFRKDQLDDNTANK
jgi:hypothetical protein